MNVNVRSGPDATQIGRTWELWNNEPGTMIREPAEIELSTGERQESIFRRRGTQRLMYSINLFAVGHRPGRRLKTW
jgi:hypothetical protein